MVDFSVPADHRVKLKENENIDKYLDLARELKKLWNMRVKMIPIIVGALGMVPKSLEDRLEEFEIRGRIETIQTTALLRSAGIFRRVLESWEELLSLTSGNNHHISPMWRNMLIRITIQQNPGDLRRLALTQTPVKDHQLLLVWKTHDDDDDDNNNNNNEIIVYSAHLNYNSSKVHVYIYQRPLHTSRMWHKVNFLSGV